MFCCLILLSQIHRYVWFLLAYCTTKRCWCTIPVTLVLEAVEQNCRVFLGCGRTRVFYQEQKRTGWVRDSEPWKLTCEWGLSSYFQEKQAHYGWFGSYLFKVKSFCSPKSPSTTCSYAWNKLTQAKPNGNSLLKA